jgi:beta-alanine--pyruvate transaminase
VTHVPQASSPPQELDAFWMPFTANRGFKQAPRLLSSAKGMHYYTEDGRAVLDGTAGLWAVNAGHCRREIIEAIAATAATLDYAPTFQMGHPLAFALAERLAGVAPAGLDRIFFANSGSEAVDTALKIALAYHCQRGQGQRIRLIGRHRGYHGVGFGGISVGGIQANRRAFGPLLPATDHLPHTYDRERQAFSRGQPIWGAHLADGLESLIALHGAESIAAVIVEPVAGSTGALIPPQGYLERLRALCDRHGLLLIFDEVITGFGRLGAPFAADYFGVIPDIMTVAKGLTNAAVPMGAVFARRDIHDTIIAAAGSGQIEFFHGYTYSGHPLAAAAGLATLDVHTREGLAQRAADLAPFWQDALHGLRGAPHVIDIRNLGLIGAVELEPLPGQPGKRAFDIFVRCFEKGLLIRVTGDIIALSPPLIIERDEIERMMSMLADALRSCA